MYVIIVEKIQWTFDLFQVHGRNVAGEMNDEQEFCDGFKYYHFNRI